MPQLLSSSALVLFYRETCMVLSSMKKFYLSTVFHALRVDVKQQDEEEEVVLFLTGSVEMGKERKEKQKCPEATTQETVSSFDDRDQRSRKQPRRRRRRRSKREKISSSFQHCAHTHSISARGH